MYILGLNAYHGDSSACLVVDGKLIAAVEEERFRRIKHWAGFPIESIKYCLKSQNISIDQIDHVAINRNTTANLFKKALFAFAKRPSLKHINDRLKNASKIGDIKAALCEGLGIKSEELKVQIHNVEHHIAHLGSAFYVSPFQNASVVSVDGFGDFVGTLWGTGEANNIVVKHRTFFPHSLGLFYHAFTQYLGFPQYGDEYKVMGMSAYGEFSYMTEMN